MPDLVLFVLVFLAAGAVLLATPLVLGRLVRPARPGADKGAVYECGEPAVGPAWVQFDLRFYVVALLFVIFDVELAFFFPWAVVFGTANQLADPDLTDAERTALVQRLDPAAPPVKTTDDPFRYVDAHKRTPEPPAEARAAKALAWVAFADLLVFFGVLLVGFAYLWRRGDLDWVRSVEGQAPPERSPPAAAGGGGEPNRAVVREPV